MWYSATKDWKSSCPTCVVWKVIDSGQRLLSFLTLLSRTSCWLLLKNVIVGYVQNEKYSDAIGVFRRMPQIGGVVSNHITLVSVLPV